MAATKMTSCASSVAPAGYRLPLAIGAMSAHVQYDPVRCSYIKPQKLATHTRESVQEREQNCVNMIQMYLEALEGSPRLNSMFPALSPLLGHTPQYIY